MELILLFVILDLIMIVVGVVDYFILELKLIVIDKKRYVFIVKNFDKFFELVILLRRKVCKGKFICIS